MADEMTVRRRRSASEASVDDRALYKTHFEACTWDLERVGASLTRRTVRRRRVRISF